MLLLEVLTGWTSDELSNLCSLLGIDQPCELRLIQERIKWLYHSKTRAGAESAIRNIGSKVLSKISESHQQRVVKSDDLREIPTYDALIMDACKHLKAFDDGASLAEHELFLSHAVIIAALQQMKPRERVKFFEEQVNMLEMLCKTQIKGPALSGPTTTFALLGASQVSGFGIYYASTTALGFLTHAVGVTLPFVVYAGMTSTIAFLIGPVGWLSAGIWGAWKLTQPKWKKLVPALVYIIVTNSGRQLKLP